MEINHIIANGHIGSKSQVCSWVVISVDRVNEPLMIMIGSKIMASDTS